METYISILRGINVGGQKAVKMQLLLEMFEGLGFKNVRTYIQSGNVVFNCKENKTEELEKIIEKEITKSFGFDVPVIVIERDELKHISEQNPFINERKEDIDKLHVTFLSGMPEKKYTDSIKTGIYLPDEYFIKDKAVYLFCPNGYGRTKLNNNFFENKLNVIATTRNWKTVNQLLVLSAEC